MKVRKEDLILYAVTDRTWLNGRSLLSQVREALEGGATFVQLREKHLDREQIMKAAEQIGALCRQYKVPFVVNDDVEIALKTGADGVHVGQDDMEAGDVRAMIGPDKILGVTAHTVEQALRAQERGADYLGVGAAFPTGSKDDTSVISHETLREICSAVDIPVVGIGGISMDNVMALRGSGISGIAVISAVFAKEDVRKAAAALRARTEEMLA